MRFKIFQKNLNKISLLNLHERGTAVYGITEFADLTYDEFRQHYLGFRADLYTPASPAYKSEVSYYGLDDVPETYDWRDVKGVVSNVKNQGMCGSCWAFSATGNVEGVWAIKKNESVSLSEQGKSCHCSIVICKLV